MTSFGAAQPKDPHAVLDYALDWGDWLQPGDGIISHVIEVDGVTLNSDARDGAIVTAWVSGGQDRSTGRIAVRITTAQGRVDERTIEVTIRQR